MYYPAMIDEKINLVGLDRDGLAREMAAIGEKPFRAKQLWHWIYHQGETNFLKMTTLAKPFRERLAETHVVSRPTIAHDKRSEDGAHKWLLRFNDGNEAETVFIPEEDRGALCISSQIGCTLTCTLTNTLTNAFIYIYTYTQLKLARGRISTASARIRMAKLLRTQMPV